MKRVMIGCSVLKKEVEAQIDNSALEFRWIKEHLINVLPGIRRKNPRCDHDQQR